MYPVDCKSSMGNGACAHVCRSACVVLMVVVAPAPGVEVAVVPAATELHPQ